MGPSEVLSVKIELDKMARVDALRARLTKQALGLEFSRSAVVRLLVDLGLEQIEARLARGELTDLLPETPGE